MSSAQQLLDSAGRRRSPATLSDFHAGKAPGNKGQRYLQGISSEEIISTVHSRRPPMMHASAGLAL